MSTIRSEKTVLTIATGKPYYLTLAANLARSFKVWHDDSDIAFALATDQPQRLPPDVREIVDVVRVEPEQYGKGFSPKLHMDKLAPAAQTLFVDADCLIAGPLEPVFERFAGRSVSVVGQMVSKGEWFGDIAARCKRFNLDGLSLFVGGIYYLERSDATQAVYETARSLEERYDEIGLIRLRGVPNEEPLVSLGMALHDQRPIPDDGRIKADAMNYPSSIELDVFEGRAVFRNENVDERPFSVPSEACPVIAHFNDTFAERDPYTHEVARLRKVSADRWPLGLAGAYAKVRHTLPQFASRRTKDALRPVYRRLFGTRDVKQSVRIPD